MQAFFVRLEKQGTGSERGHDTSSTFDPEILNYPSMQGGDDAEWTTAVFTITHRLPITIPNIYRNG
jgi:hypothetical protein